MIPQNFAIGQIPAYQPKNLGASLKTLATEKVHSQKRKIYFKEAEDISEKRALPRSYSLSQLSKIEEIDEVACKKRTSALWNCVGRRPIELKKGRGIAGYLYYFQAKPEYNPSKKEFDDFVKSLDSFAKIKILFNSFHETNKKCKQKNKELFPVVEVNTDPFSFPFGFKKFKFKTPFEKNRVMCIELPDADLLNALIKNYCLEKEQKLNKKIGEIKIYSTKGVSDDLSFALAHLKGGVLSDGVEFIHDQFFHIFPRLKRLIDDLLIIRNKEKTFYLYHQTEKELIKFIFSTHIKIEKAKAYSQRLEKPKDQIVEEYCQLNFLLGCTVDAIFDMEREELESFLINFDMKKNIELTLNDKNWGNFFKKRFPINTPTIEAMQNLWQLVEEAVANYPTKAVNKTAS